MYIENLVKNNSCLDPYIFDSSRKGGSLDFRGLNLYIDFSYFINNIATIGSCIYIRGPNCDIVVQNSIFKQNYAGDGGCLAVNREIKYFNMIFNQNFLYENKAEGNFYYFV